MNYLIDTNVISEIMRKEPDQRVMQWFSTLNKIYFSTITMEEIYYGLSRKKLFQKLSWFQQFSADRAEFLAIDQSAARWCGERRGDLSSRGITVTMADALIAATAHEHNLVLATRNTRDFENFGIALYNPFLA